MTSIYNRYLSLEEIEEIEEIEDEDLEEFPNSSELARERAKIAEFWNDPCWG